MHIHIYVYIYIYIYMHLHTSIHTYITQASLVDADREERQRQTRNDMIALYRQLVDPSTSPPSLSHPHTSTSPHRGIVAGGEDGRGRGGGGKERGGEGGSEVLGNSEKEEEQHEEVGVYFILVLYILCERWGAGVEFHFQEVS